MIQEVNVIQNCQKCSKEFTWKAIQKSLLWGYKPITCTSCSSTHEITFLSRIGLVLFTTAIPMLLVFNPVMDIRLEFEIALYLVWVAIVVCIAPLFVKYVVK
ncbi:TIGR04104 family putative zinc finger protein [Youngiibacter fragilis]|uniref:Cxxc_20_cxxc protein n=1 Tax=Youngiibacter fragilis 232.1 TaxID=994573 RepID=V7I5X7_9CLOT|nr:TIGR04104 family putative zinc finger protein [Youngiibacter fragilis]ETA81605.1 hypothetical protein T472_0205505 [Youngiibacter fragilis 232.1]